MYIVHSFINFLSSFRTYSGPISELQSILSDLMEGQNITETRLTELVLTVKELQKGGNTLNYSNYDD